MLQNYLLLPSLEKLLSQATRCCAAGVCAAVLWGHADANAQRQDPGATPENGVVAMNGASGDASQAVADTLPALERGLASWYGAQLHRRRTASGERFDMHALTAAHPSLPFGSQVCVRSLVTGKTVVVRINDRGPHVGNRIIDLSRAAAQALGMLGLGTKPVALTALKHASQDCA